MSVERKTIMGRIWRDGKLVGVVGEGRNCRSGCVFPTEEWGDDEPFGFGVGAAKYKGTSQAFLHVKDLVRADPNGEALVLGADKRVYEARGGLIECLAPTIPTSNEPKVYVDSIDWRSFPPPSALARLFSTFFSQYTDREVLMLVGKKKNRLGWLYLVPEQVGTCGSVKWVSDDEEMNWFQEQAQWIGTIHSHPGNCCEPSQTDIDDWAKPEKSGLHLIFGRDGSYTVSGAIAEKTFEVDKGSISNIVDRVSQQPIEYYLSKGRSLAELLKKPKPTVARTVQRGAIHIPGKPKIPGKSKESLWGSNLPLWDESNDKDFVEETLAVIGALPLIGEDRGVPVLRIVEYNGQLYALTLNQYAELIEWCREVCPVPRSRRLRLYGTRGGGK